MDTITVVVTCYNLEKEITRALDAVAAQTYPSLEVIVVDDGSTDGSVRVIEQWMEGRPGTYRLIKQANAGPGAARNAGIEAATGTLIGFVDGDDVPHPRMYEILEKCLRKCEADVAVCAHESVEGGDGDAALRQAQGPQLVAQGLQSEQQELSGKVAVAEMDREKVLKRLVTEDERTPIRNAVWNKLYRRELIGEVRFGTKQYYEDILFTVKVLLRAEKAVYVDEPLYTYIADRNASIMNRGVNKRIVTEQIPAYEAKSALLRKAGYEELADTHDYMVCTKLMQLYTEASESDDPDKRDLAEPIADYLYAQQGAVHKIFSVPSANRKQRLRMQLFLTHPMLYNSFTSVNNARIKRFH